MKPEPNSPAEHFAWNAPEPTTAVNWPAVAFWTVYFCAIAGGALFAYLTT